MALARVMIWFAAGLAFVAAMDETPVKPLQAMTPSEEAARRAIIHYQEMGCRPVYSKKSLTYAERFECPDTTRADPKKCYYKSKEYDLRQALSNDVNDNKCMVECFCREDMEGKGQFACAQVECPEDFDRWSKPVEERCVYQYKSKDCCSYKQVCDKAAIAALKTCEWDGKVYREGERFHPDGNCDTCICGKDFDGTLKSLQCEQINCGHELFYSREAREGCAPIYLQSRNCCPIGWRCPESQDQIRHINAQPGEDDRMKCTYGKQKLDVGDTVDTGDKDKCVTCKCEIPPLVTCTQKIGC